MKKDTFTGVWEHLINAEAMASAHLLTLQKKEILTQEQVIQMERVGQLQAKISRARRDWEYWFVPLDFVKGKGTLKQDVLPMEKTWYTE